MQFSVLKPFAAETREWKDRRRRLVVLPTYRQSVAISIPATVPNRTVQRPTEHGRFLPSQALENIERFLGALRLYGW
jgi:hypothetical protein